MSFADSLSEIPKSFGSGTPGHEPKGTQRHLELSKARVGETEEWDRSGRWKKGDISDVLAAVSTSAVERLTLRVQFNPLHIYSEAILLAIIQWGSFFLPVNKLKP